MVRQILTLTVILSASLGQIRSQNKFTESNVVQTEVSTKDIKIKNALAFINGYTKNANNISGGVGSVQWVNSNNLSTKNFKTELERINDDAEQEDPELGLDSDPVFDAQDNPEEGFELESFDEDINILIVRGIDCPEFKVTMKVVKEGKQWVVDGCGIVNILNEKRAAR